jgi:hypothetical protein
VQISGFNFPDGFYFWINDPNGGMWIKELLNDKTQVIRIGISAIIAKRLEIIKKIDYMISSSRKIDHGKPFVRIQGKEIEVTLFAPFSIKINRINSELIDIKLTQNNVYDFNNFWLIEIELENQTKLPSLQHWYQSPHPKIEKYVNQILKLEKKLKENCCPDFKKSNIVYRKK